MEKRQMLAAMGFQLSLLGTLLVSSCAADGGFASKSKPLDFEKTRVAMCEGAHQIDVVFQNIAAVNPGKIPSKVMDAEGGFMYDIGYTSGNVDPARVGSLCAATYAGDLNVAVTTVIATITNISGLIQKWQGA